MSQIPTSMGMSSRNKGEFDIYGVMLAIASAFVLIATIYVAYKSSTMMNSLLPLAGE